MRRIPHGTCGTRLSIVHHRSEVAETGFVQPIASSVRRGRRRISFIEHLTGPSVLRAPRD